MKKLLKSRKALSPVIAAIILIAVTVAVSIAVAAWMGSLSMGFMATKELRIDSFVIDDTAETITITASNTGTGDVTVSGAKINGEQASLTAFTVPDGGSTTSAVTITASQDLVSGNKYTLNLIASDGTIVCSYTDTA